jgi:hypothetical protein
VAGYDGAPERVELDLSAPPVVGTGWHAFESHGTDGFRWTAEPDAELFFVAYAPQPLTLHVDAEPGSGDWTTADMRVTLNGAGAQCTAASMPCDWALPVEALRRGLNVVTLHATPVAAPAPDPRRLGLHVSGASLLASR